MMEYLNVVAIIVAGLMVGSELAIAAFVHPTLDRLPDNACSGGTRSRCSCRAASMSATSPVKVLTV